MTTIVLVPLFALSGLFNKLPNIPVYVRWLHFISPFMYGYQLVLQNEYRDEKIGGFDYQHELGFLLDYEHNFYALCGVILTFYVLGFIFLVFFTDKITA